MLMNQYPRLSVSIKGASLANTDSKADWRLIAQLPSDCDALIGRVLLTIELSASVEAAKWQQCGCLEMLLADPLLSRHDSL